MIQCPECSELVAFDTCTCPACGADKVCSRGGVGRSAALLGITLATGCGVSQPVYSAPTAVVLGGFGVLTGFYTGTGTTPQCDPIVLFFDGEIATVSGTPLGLDDSVRTETVTGSMSYLPCLGDENATDPQRGEYRHPFDGRVELLFAGTQVDGSDQAIVTTENFDPDTFRFEDGALAFETDPRMLQVNGAAAPDLQVRFSITDSSGAALATDAPPDPFSFDPSMPHTFSLQDGGGTLLLQLDSLSKR